MNVRLVAMLERLRGALGGRLVAISSGYRCPPHNRAIGGVPKSQHLMGNAADVAVGGTALAEVAAAAKALLLPGWRGTRGSHRRCAGRRLGGVEVIKISFGEEDSAQTRNTALIEGSFLEPGDK